MSPGSGDDSEFNKIAVTYDENNEKSPPICFVYSRWALFLVIETIILMTLFLQADKRRSAFGRRRIKKPPCDKGGVPALRKFCGAAVFSCKGLGGTSPGRGAYHVARVYVLDFRSAP